MFKKSAKIAPMVVEAVSEVEAEEELKMRVLSLYTVMRMYGGQRHPSISLYEVLEEDLITDVPDKSTIIYISHEWAGTDHPDPDGTQMYHLLLLLERLQNGEVPRTEMDVFHSLIYKQNHTTTAKEWKYILNSEKTFIWYDGFSVPRSRREDGFRSIPLYMRRCDFMIILAPGCTHFDRIDASTQRKMNLCYRTYRLRARCVLELFCAFLTTRGGEKARPALLVRSGTGNPNWISPLECQKLAVGTSSFQCCESNHTIIKICRRSDSLVILDRLIEERARSLFVSNNYAEARFSLCLRNYWCRGLIDEETKMSWNSIVDFKSSIRWSDIHDDAFVDREGFPLLGYVAMSDCTKIVQDILMEIRETSGSHQLLRVRAPKEGLVGMGITGSCTVLGGAMMMSSPETVALLLEHGVNPFETDISGTDPFMFASMFGRLDNVKLWLNRFPDWDLDRKNTIMGAAALDLAVYMGPNRLEVVKVLLEHGASMSMKNYSGASILTSLCASEDCDPEIVKLVCTSERKNVNYQRCGQTLKWRNIYRLARALVGTKLSKSGVMLSLARAPGSTALHYAVRRGDSDVVNLLLQHGADPSVIDGIGKSPVNYCDAFPELRGALKRVIKQRQEGNGRRTTTLMRRNSTATDMKFPMYLVPLNQLDRLYGGKDPRHTRIEAHQELKRRGELVRWENLPIDAHIIFLSHEWVGWSHPDPHGIQLKTFLQVMKRLGSGEISQVEMNVTHSKLYKKNHIVRAEEWKELMSTAYVWIDWASMPQPSACSPSVSQEKKKKMETDLGNAVKSIPAYVAVGA
jgi:hypothetical protein